MSRQKSSWEMFGKSIEIIVEESAMLVDDDGAQVGVAKAEIINEDLALVKNENWNTAQ